MNINLFVYFYYPSKKFADKSAQFIFRLKDSNPFGMNL